MQQSAARDQFHSQKYRPRLAADTLLYKVVQENIHTLFAEAEATGNRFPPHVYREVFSYLDCGIPAKGFVRVRCGSCKFEKLVPFSCKRRGFCPSCGGRRMNEVAAHLVESVLPKTGVRQWVLSYSFNVRYLLSYNPRLITKLLKIYASTISIWYKKQARARGLKSPETGAITFIQRAGSAINLNVHFHSIFLDGVFCIEKGKHRFHTITPPTDDEISKIVQEIADRTLFFLEAMDLGENSGAEDPVASNDELQAQVGGASIQSRIALGERAGKRVRKLGVGADIGHAYNNGRRCAVASGFSLHADVSIPANARDKVEKLLRYTARPPIAQDRLSQLPNGKLAYKLKSTYSDGTTHIMLDPIELVEKLVALIPPPRANLLRYHGVLAPNAKARKHIVPVQKNGATKRKPNRSKNRNWSEMMKRVFGFDVLKCPSCGAKMKVISTLMDDEVVKPFLRAVKHPDEPPEPAPARAPPSQDDPVDYDQSPLQDPDGF